MAIQSTVAANSATAGRARAARPCAGRPAVLYFHPMMQQNPPPLPPYQSQPSGQAWPSVQRVTISAGTAFKAGFFAFFGSLLAYLVIAAVVIAIVAALGGLAVLSGTRLGPLTGH